METKLAKEQVNNQTNKSLVPAHIKTSVLVTFCYDNCDHNMESIYNTTLNCTNGIIIHQLDKQQVEAMGTILQSLALKEVHSSLYITSCSRISRKKKGKIQYQSDTNINLLNGKFSKLEDLLWLLLSYRHKDNQVIPGWKGFFYESTKETADIHIAKYLSTI